MKTLLVLAAFAAATSTDPISILDQQDGINSHRKTTVALYCHKVACAGKVKLKLAGKTIGSAPFAIAAKSTDHVPVTISRSGFAAIKAKPRRKAQVTLAATMVDGQVLTHVITLYA